MALELQSVGALAQSGEWFSEPASGLPEIPRMLQGKGPQGAPEEWGEVWVQLCEHMGINALFLQQIE